MARAWPTSLICANVIFLPSFFRTTNTTMNIEHAHIFGLGRWRGCQRQRYIDVAFIIQFDFFSRLFFVFLFIADGKSAGQLFARLSFWCAINGGGCLRLSAYLFFSICSMGRSSGPLPSTPSYNRFLFLFRILCRCACGAETATRTLLWHNIKFYRQFWRCGVAYHKVEPNNPLFPSNSSVAHRNQRPTDTTMAAMVRPEEQIDARIASTKTTRDVCNKIKYIPINSHQAMCATQCRNEWTVGCARAHQHFPLDFCRICLRADAVHFSTCSTASFYHL